MSYKVLTIPVFEKELKKLSKKYPSLKKEFIELVHHLQKEPEFGISIGGGLLQNKTRNCF
jgi:mRNA-degrading endonuclease RelE of RelBE toxin-antitoxin system